MAIALQINCRAIQEDLIQLLIQERHEGDLQQWGDLWIVINGQTLYPLKTGLTGFVGGLLAACERKRKVKNDSKISSLSN